MAEHQEHFDRKFYQDLKTGYWISTDYPRIRAHRWVWNNIHGKIPKGYHIHHKDENKSNNNIINLELIECSRHYRHHYTEEKRAWSRKWAEKIRPLTKAWHASEEGIAWHKRHARKCNFGNWEPVDYKCEQCGKDFKSKKHSITRFCSNNCKSKWRRLSGIDDADFPCERCTKMFRKNKYGRKKFCGNC